MPSTNSLEDYYPSRCGPSYRYASQVNHAKIYEPVTDERTEVDPSRSDHLNVSEIPYQLVPASCDPVRGETTVRSNRDEQLR